MIAATAAAARACRSRIATKSRSSRALLQSLAAALDWRRGRRRARALGAGGARQAGAVLGDGVAAARVPDLQRRRPGADAAGRSAAARARRRDRDRADRRPARPRRFRRRAAAARTDAGAACRPARSRCRRSSCPTASSEPGLLKRLGAQTVVAATRARDPAARPPVRARPLRSARRWARRASRAQGAADAALQLRHARRRRAHRAPTPQRYLASYPNAIARHRRAAARRRARERRRHLDQAAARCSRATKTRSASACSPSCCRACGSWSSRRRAPTST